MMTSSNGNISASLAICAGNSPVPVNFPHKGQWRGALMFALICVWINAWVNSRKAGDLRRYCAHYDVIVMLHPLCLSIEVHFGNLRLGFELTKAPHVLSFMDEEWGSNVYTCVYIYKTTNMNITRARVQFKINTGIEINTCSFQMGCQLSSAAWPAIGTVFFGQSLWLVRMCWTTGSWWCCLSLNVLSSIPTWCAKICSSIVGCMHFPVPEHQN